jgi:hypothetical protein
MKLDARPVARDRSFSILTVAFQRRSGRIFVLFAVHSNAIARRCKNG